MLSEQRLSEIRARLKAATPGPWVGDRHDGTVKYEVIGQDGRVVLKTQHKSGEYGFVGENGDHDEAFFLASRADIADLLAEVERLRKPPVARPLDDWHEDYGSVLWWTLPVVEPPHVGTPTDSEWPGYHTHWTPIECPEKGVSE